MAKSSQTVYEQVTLDCLLIWLANIEIVQDVGKPMLFLTHSRNIPGLTDLKHSMPDESVKRDQGF